MTSPTTELLDALPDIVWEADAAGTLTGFNAAGRSYLGRTLPVASGADGWLGFAHPDDHRSLVTVRTRAIETGEPYEFECRLRRHDGALRWHRVRGVPLRDPDGELTGWAGTCVDVHDGHVSEEKVTIARTLLNKAPVGFGFVDVRRRFRYVTPRLAEINGLPVDDHLGRHVAEILPELWPQLAPLYDRVIDEGESIGDLEIAGRTPADPDRDRHWIANYYPVERGDVRLGAGLILTEVTDIVAKDRELEERRRLLERAERVAGIATWVRDLRTGVGWATPGFYEMLGIPPGEPGLVTFRDFVVPEEREKVDRSFRELLETGGPATFRFRLMLHGTERLLDFHAATERDEQGELVRIIGTTVDVTDRIAAEHERIELLERAITVAEDERTRIAEHLHDDTIQALSAALLRVDHAGLTHDDSTFSDVRRPIEHAIESLRLTILELHPPDVTAARLPSAIAAYAQRTLEPVAAEVDLDVDVGDTGEIPDDVSGTIYRIVQEALANVRRHAGADRVEVSIRRRADRITVSVADDGVGFDPAQESAAGHVGLRLMRDRAQHVGGDLRIESGPEGGTTVRFELSLAPPA